MQREFIPELIAEIQRTSMAQTLTVDWEGEQAQTVESIISMFIGFAVALLCMFVLLTLQFQILHATADHHVHHSIRMDGSHRWPCCDGMDLTLFSFFGLIALTGVIVNDSIVLVDFINHRVRDGVPLYDALMSAGKRRFRPILLTSMTTIAGLTPILLEKSMQAQVLIPMAISLIFGLLTGTLLILILVPVFYHIYGTILEKLGISLYHDDDEGGGGGDRAVHPQPSGNGSAEIRPAEPVLARESGELGTATS